MRRRHSGENDCGRRAAGGKNENSSPEAQKKQKLIETAGEQLTVDASGGTAESSDDIHQSHPRRRDAVQVLVLRQRVTDA
jgi:hypothetical protein